MPWCDEVPAVIFDVVDSNNDSISNYVTVFEYLDAIDSYVWFDKEGVSGTAGLDGNVIKVDVNSSASNVTVFLSYRFSENMRMNDSSINLFPTKDGFMGFKLEEPGTYEFSISYVTGFWERVAEMVSAICFLTR